MNEKSGDSVGISALKVPTQSICIQHDVYTLMFR